MESLYFLIPCAFIFIVIAVKVLFWAINAGQYDNLDTEAHRILFDDEKSKLDFSPKTGDSNPTSASDEPKPRGTERENNPHD